MIVLTLCGWLVAIALVAVQQTLFFWIAANVVGLSLGASQSAARAMVGYLSPPGRSGEFFGLWGLAVKLSSILGPITYGLVTWTTGGAHRIAMLVTGLFFVAGIVLVASVDTQRGRRAALESSP